MFKAPVRKRIVQYAACRYCNLDLSEVIKPYKRNYCSKACYENYWLTFSKNYQREHYGSLVFIQPLKDNGAFDLGAYNGHWLNKAWNKEHGVYYYDVQDDLYFHTKAEVLDWYEWMTGKKAIVYNIQEGEVPPFGLIWHY